MGFWLVRNREDRAAAVVSWSRGIRCRGGLSLLLLARLLVLSRWGRGSDIACVVNHKRLDRTICRRAHCRTEVARHGCNRVAIDRQLRTGQSGSRRERQSCAIGGYNGTVVKTKIR